MKYILGLGEKSPFYTSFEKGEKQDSFDPSLYTGYHVSCGGMEYLTFFKEDSRACMITLVTLAYIGFPK
jgi:hypothetical protein